MRTVPESKADATAVDFEQVTKLSNELQPMLKGYTANEMAHAFFLLMFRVGVSIGESQAPVVVVGIPEEEVQELKGSKKNAKTKKEYIN